MTKTYLDYQNEIGKKESRGVYGKKNTYDYLGKYQMGWEALKQVGYYKGDINPKRNKNQWNGKWTGKDGVYSTDDFLNNHQL